MYQLIEMYGDFEPWWFLEDWRDAIISEVDFDSYVAAKDAFGQRWNQMRQEFGSFISQRDLLAAFWDKGDTRWCEECDDDIQQYHSLLLLKDGQVLPLDQQDEDYQLANDKPQPFASCAIKS